MLKKKDHTMRWVEPNTGRNSRRELESRVEQITAQHDRDVLLVATARAQHTQGVPNPAHIEHYRKPRTSVSKRLNEQLRNQGDSDSDGGSGSEDDKPLAHRKGKEKQRRPGPDVDQLMDSKANSLDGIAMDPKTEAERLRLAEVQVQELTDKLKALTPSPHRTPTKPRARFSLSPQPKTPGENGRSAPMNKLLKAVQEYRLQVLGVVRIKAGRGKQILEYNYPRAPLRPEADRENLLYPDVFDEGRYTLAWGESAGSAYNSDAHRLLARRLIEDRGYQYAKGLTLQQEDQPIIEEMLYNGYKYLKDQRELSVNRERLTPDEVLAREAERIDRAKAERCRNLWERNLGVMLDTEELSPFIPHWQIFNNDGTSSDEDDGIVNGVRQYSILRQVWRSAELQAFCRFLDRQYIALHPDTRMRLRVPSVRVSTAPAPKGLPINWYSRTWLNTLTEQQRRNLHLGDPVPLVIPDNLHTPGAGGSGGPA